MAMKGCGALADCAAANVIQRAEVFMKFLVEGSDETHAKAQIYWAQNRQAVSVHDSSMSEANEVSSSKFGQS
jgi:hypothetical protein